MEFLEPENEKTAAFLSGKVNPKCFAVKKAVRTDRSGSHPVIVIALDDDPNLRFQIELGPTDAKRLIAALISELEGLVAPSEGVLQAKEA